MRRPTLSMAMFDWGVRHVIILLYVQFLIRLAAVSYRAEKVRTVVCPVVRSVNKLCDTRNCVQNGAEYSICVLFITCLYYKALRIIVCTLSNTPQLQPSWRWSLWRVWSPQGVSEFESNFWLVSSLWKFPFPFDWDICSEYRKPIAQVGGA